MSLLSTIAFILISTSFAQSLINGIIKFELRDGEAFFGQLLLMTLFLILTKLEITSTDKTINKVLNKEKVKGLFTV